MGSEIKNDAEKNKKRIDYWKVDVTARINGQREGTTVEVDVPTESEILKALCKKNKWVNPKYIEIIEIRNQYKLTKWE